MAMNEITRDDGRTVLEIERCVRDMLKLMARIARHSHAPRLLPGLPGAKRQHEEVLIREFAV
jgi:hypothetical protein